MSCAASSLLEAGANFTVHTSGQGQSAQKYYVFYSPQDRFGALYLAPEPDKSKRLEQSW